MRLAPTHSDHTLKQVSINGKAAGESQRPRDTGHESRQAASRDEK